jgi:hypothetical protein
MQGCVKNGKYYLCDVEFSHTLSKFRMPPKDLLMAYKAARQFRREGTERNLWSILGLKKI